MCVLCAKYLCDKLLKHYRTILLIQIIGKKKGVKRTGFIILPSIILLRRNRSCYLVRLDYTKYAIWNLANFVNTILVQWVMHRIRQNRRESTKLCNKTTCFTLSPCVKLQCTLHTVLHKIVNLYEYSRLWQNPIIQIYSIQE